MKNTHSSDTIAPARVTLEPERGVLWASTKHSRNKTAFEVISKRRKGFPSETRVKRGLRVVHGNKELLEKLGRFDPCPCGSAKRFKNCCMKTGLF
jgi:uncharacterized protein YecA (UPF0149 family)